MVIDSFPSFRVPSLYNFTVPLLFDNPPPSAFDFPFATPKGRIGCVQPVTSSVSAKRIPSHLFTRSLIPRIQHTLDTAPRAWFNTVVHFEAKHAA